MLEVVAVLVERVDGLGGPPDAVFPAPASTGLMTC